MTLTTLFRQLFVIATLLLSCIVHAEENLSLQEERYFDAYDKLHQQAVRFHAAVKRVRPAKGQVYSEQDLSTYHAWLEKLYIKKPEYRGMTTREAKSDKMMSQIAELVGADESEVGLYEAAHDISLMTGLPHRELAVAQKDGGLSSLRRLIWSVKNLTNRQWVSWYLMLINHGDDTAQKQLFIDDGADYPDIAALRAEYGALAKVFNQARKRLKQAETTALEASEDPTQKSRLAVKLFIHRYTSKKAGRVGRHYGNRGGYPLVTTDKRRYDKSAALADKLGVLFTDFAYIKKAEGNYGLRKVVRGMTWITDREAILAEVFD